jgi:hypothetical protein
VNFSTAISVSIGPLMEVSNRRIGRTWVGPLEDVCEGMIAEGMSVPTIWGDIDTQVIARHVRASIQTAMGRKSREKIGCALPSQWATAEDGRFSEIERWRSIARALGESDRIALARLAFACGDVNAAEEWCICENFDPSTKDEYGMTAVAWGCALGRFSCLQWAIAVKHPLDSISKFGWNYCDLGKANKHPDLVKALTDRGIFVGQSLAHEMRRYGIPMR